MKRVNLVRRGFPVESAPICADLRGSPVEAAHHEVVAAALLAVFITAKALAVAGHQMPPTWWMPVAYLWHDAALALVFGAIEAAALARSGDGTGRVTAAGRSVFVWTVYATIVAYVVLNVPVTRALATPMTWPMWRAARGPLADSIWRYATVETLLVCSLVASIGLIAPIVLRHAHRAYRDALVALSMLLVALGPIAAARVDTRGLERNAWTALITSAVPRAPAAASTDGWTRIGFEHAPDDQLTSSLAAIRGAAAGRSIVLVSLESTGAQYLGLYGAHPDVMPNLSTLAEHAIVFDHAYAVYPESIKGLYSLLCSACPPLDSDPTSYGSAHCQSIADLLKRRGYRTGLFHSGRFAYLGMDALVRDRGYEVLADAGDIGGQRQSSFGVDEPSTVARILRWIDGLSPGSRFFVTYLPVAGHHPYDTPDRGPYDDRDEQGRYRNALHYGDASLGTLMRGLDARGLTNDILWIVVGDHGEAFGQHDGNYGHTFHVYEENIHVPLAIAAPGLIARQERSPLVVSLLDIAPTVQDLLGDPAPYAYEGHSMLDGTSRMAFFYTDYSRSILGSRDGRLKTIVELDSGRTRLFDLDTDPGERSDVAGRYPDRASWYERNLRRWIVAHQERVRRTDAALERKMSELRPGKREGR
jgi:sulfatase-like protein